MGADGVFEDDDGGGRCAPGGVGVEGCGQSEVGEVAEACAADYRDTDGVWRGC